MAANLPALRTTPLVMLPGIQRDGTRLAGRNWSEGQHCRFQRGLPRKIGGYEELYGDLEDVPRGTIIVPNPPNFDVYVGDLDSVKYFTMSPQRVILSGPTLVDRTPVTFAANPNNDWFFDVMFSTTDDGAVLIAYAGPNLGSIDNNVEAEIYFGELLSSTPLTSTGISTSGGIVVLHPFLFIFGNDGHIRWTEANNPTTLATNGDARVSATKIVAGIATRGGNSSPAGLFWSLNNLIRCTFTGGPEQFTFDTISDETSILSAKSVIEYDGLYFWITNDKRFCVYNGTVNEVPNSMNANFFFDNLNYAQRQKVWATKVPRFGEIWWHFPFGDSEECNEVIIYNKRENTWYDTRSNRTCGTFNQIFQFPVWLGNTADDFTIYAAPYSVWAHEIGDDKNINGNLTAIPASIKSCPIANPAYGPSGDFTGLNRWTEFYQFEPDMIQRGDMTLNISGRQYARSEPPQTAPAITITPTTERLDILVQYREMQLEFVSNTVGGYFEFGNHLSIFKVGDARE